MPTPKHKKICRLSRQLGKLWGSFYCVSFYLSSCMFLDLEYIYVSSPYSSSIVHSFALVVVFILAFAPFDAFRPRSNNLLFAFKPQILRCALAHKQRRKRQKKREGEKMNFPRSRVLGLRISCNLKVRYHFFFVILSSFTFARSFLCLIYIDAFYLHLCVAVCCPFL